MKRAGSARLFPGVGEILKSLKVTRTQSILSAAAQWHLDEITAHFNIQHHFHYRFGIDNHYAGSKLDRGKELIEVSGIPAADTILIGDTDHDYEVAGELGISCLLVADGHQSPERLKCVSPNVISGRRMF